MSPSTRKGDNRVRLFSLNRFDHHVSPVSSRFSRGSLASNRGAYVLLAWITTVVGWSQFACADDPAEDAAHIEEPDDSSVWIQRFTKEYPAAAAELERNVQNVICEGQYTAPKLVRFEPSIAFRIMKAGTQIRWHRQTENAGELVDVRNKSEHFSLIGEKQEDEDSTYYLQDLRETPSKRTKNQFDLFCRRFLHATTCLWDQRSLLEAFQAEDLTLTGAQPHATEPRWVSFSVEYRHRPGYPTYGKGDGRAVGDGIITLSPDEGWSIREYEYNLPYTRPLHIKASVTVQQPEGMGFVPQRFEYVSTILREGKEEWDVMEEYTCDISAIRTADYADSEFSLAAFGVERPDGPLDSPTGHSRTWVWINVGFITLIGLILCIRHWKHRNGQPHTGAS